MTASFPVFLGVLLGLGFFAFGLGYVAGFADGLLGRGLWKLVNRWRRSR